MKNIRHPCASHHLLLLLEILCPPLTEGLTGSHMFLREARAVHSLPFFLRAFLTLFFRLRGVHLGYASSISGNRFQFLRTTRPFLFAFRGAELSILRFFRAIILFVCLRIVFFSAEDAERVCNRDTGAVLTDVVAFTVFVVSSFWAAGKNL